MFIFYKKMFFPSNRAGVFIYLSLSPYLINLIAFLIKDLFIKQVDEFSGESFVYLGFNGTDQEINEKLEGNIK